ncbi:amidohydrolase family protein [Nannocystis sp. ILAH1]|uniref:amidohydrolase family protein n=1 Tax=Nannocystis sp. ILAH1 TaxID=2996789 RepID=UPI00226D91D6|nr:amidohydrolase family protein [Nannocystis sp. ILAH1]MCY0992112.1 amidohydrolase family protein [Nannocystis sp. ILAH1]
MHRSYLRFPDFAPYFKNKKTTTRLGSLGCWIFALAGCPGGSVTTTDGGDPTGSDSDSTAMTSSTSGSTSDPTEPTAASTSTTGEPDPTTGTSTDGVSITGVSTDSTSTDSTSTTGTSTDSTSTTGTSTTDTSTDGSTTDSTSTGGESVLRAVKLGRLIDPLDGSVLAPAIVIVHDDRVVAIETDEAQIPDGAEIIDWSAYSGVPGLVDAHTHFAYQTDDEPGTDPWSRSWYLLNTNPTVVDALARQAAEETVKLGVTTAIDKGAGTGAAILFQMRDDSAAGKLVGPRIYTAGRGISGPVPSIEYLENRIQQSVAGGVDLIKLYADSCSDDTLTCTPNFTFEQLKAAVDEAHLHGKPIAIHAYHADTAKLVIMAGPDAMEHPEGLDAVDFMDMIALGITYVPTIDHNRYYRDNLDYFHYDPGMEAEFNAYIALNLATTNQAHLAGVEIAMGSDAVFTGFGENTRELEWFLDAGMTPLEALRAATIHGAASIGVDDEVGRVAVGYFADIVAVDGDPLTDTSVLLHKVHGVMKGGELISP